MVAVRELVVVAFATDALEMMPTLTATRGVEKVNVLCVGLVMNWGLIRVLLRVAAFI